MTLERGIDMKYLTLIGLSFLLAHCTPSNQPASAPAVAQASAAPQPCPLVWPNGVLHSFGDSITWGVGATTPCGGYQALLTNYLFYANDNQGISGSMMTDYHYNQMMAVQEKPTDINTLFSGTNDVTRFGNDPQHLALFTQELTTALIRLSNISALVVVAPPIKVPSWAMTFYDNNLALHTDANVELYSNAIKQVIKTLDLSNVIFLDINKVYNPYTMVSNDGEHPSDVGHGIIARAFYQVIYNYQNEEGE